LACPGLDGPGRIAAPRGDGQLPTERRGEHRVGSPEVVRGLRHRVAAHRGRALLADGSSPALYPELL